MAGTAAGASVVGEQGASAEEGTAAAVSLAEAGGTMAADGSVGIEVTSMGVVSGADSGSASASRRGGSIGLLIPGMATPLGTATLTIRTVHTVRIRIIRMVLMHPTWTIRVRTMLPLP
jgi:hypothetical protein